MTILESSRIKSTHSTKYNYFHEASLPGPEVRACEVGHRPFSLAKSGEARGPPRELALPIHSPVAQCPCQPQRAAERKELCSTYPHISAWGTHHGRCWRRHDGGGRDGVGEWCEGVLVCVLMRVLVLVLVLVELCPQVGRRAQGGPAVSTLRGQKTCVQFLAQDVLLWKRRDRDHEYLS